MSISFQCPQCGKKLKAPDEAAGKSSTCPGCGGTVTCPEPIYDAEPIDASSQPPPGHDPYADLDDGTPYGVAGPQPGTASSAEGRRPCPMCGEMILTTAAKCRYCGEVLDPALKKAKVKKKSKKSGADDEHLTMFEIIVAVLCSGIGCIAGIVWMIQGKPKGKKMFGLSLLMVVIGIILNVAAALINQKAGIPGGP